MFRRRVKEAIHIRLHPNNINRDNGIEFQMRGCPRSNNITAGRYHNGPLRKQRLIRTMRIAMHQSQTTKVPLILRHIQSTLSPDKDQAPVVQKLDSGIHRINNYPVDKC